MDRRRLDAFGTPKITLLLVCLGFGLILGVGSLSASSESSSVSAKSYPAKRSTDVVRALVAEPDGTLIAAGRSRRGAHGQRFALARYTPAGKLDRRFGTGGKVLTGFGLRMARPGFQSFAEVASLAIQRDGKIVVAGYAAVPPGFGYWAFALARYTPAGKLDRTFGRKGTVLTSFRSRANSSAHAVAITPDGKIVAVGYCDCHPFRFALARYRPGGRLDPSFGRDGKVLTSFSATKGSDAKAVAIQPDGKIVVVGDAYGATANFAVAARYKPDGSLDRSFGTGGRVVTQVGEGSNNVTAMVVQPDGKVVVACVSALVRYNADGVLDPSFGRGGIAVTNAGAAWALAIQRDRKLVTALDPFGLARFLEDGSPDPSFGRNGRTRTDARATANGVVVRTDGKIVAAGTVGTSPRRDFVLARYTSNGRLDGSFGSGGKVLTDFGSIWATRGR
jgi:uncharacterized delta-60 repeat protein